jgi:hypothetical protein
MLHATRKVRQTDNNTMFIGPCAYHKDIFLPQMLMRSWGFVVTLNTMACLLSDLATASQYTLGTSALKLLSSSQELWSSAYPNHLMR